MHYAVHGHTAAELIYERADADKPHMGLTVSAYLDLAEDRAERHIPMTIERFFRMQAKSLLRLPRQKQKHLT